MDTLHIEMPLCKSEEFKLSLASLNKKLSKYGSSCKIISHKLFTVEVEQIDGVFIYSSISTRKRLIDNAIFHTVQAIAYDISYPEVNGKQGVTFLGAMTNDNGIYFAVSATDTPIHNLFKDNDVCEHCNVKRARNTYYIFNDNGIIKQVGSTCCFEYFGINIDALFSHFQAFQKSLRDSFTDDMEVPFDSIYTSFYYVARLVNEVTQNFTLSWKSGEDGTNTSIKALASLIHEKHGNYTWQTAVDIESIKSKVSSYWKAVTPSNDFEFNVLSLLFANDELRYDVLLNKQGIVAYAIWKACYEVVKESAGNDYIGTVNEKVTFKATMRVISRFETQYGFTTIVEFKTENNDILKWFASGLNMEMQLCLDSNLHTFSGTVKEHSTWKDVKQTIVTRVKVK